VRRYFLASEEEARGILLTIVRRWLRTAVAVLQTEELSAVEGQVRA